MELELELYLVLRSSFFSWSWVDDQVIYICPDFFFPRINSCVLSISNNKSIHNKNYFTKISSSMS